MNKEELIAELEKLIDKCNDATHNTSIETDISFYNGMAKGFEHTLKLIRETR